ncbi:MAG: class I SAM-dependent methyltransferase [Haloplanus sp.]
MTDEWGDPARLNRRAWDELAAVHPETPYYDVEGFLDGGSSLYPVEREELADVVDAEVDLLHPMCHFGLDTLSWARRVDSVVGVDFSEVAIEQARELADEAGIENARFVRGNVLDLDLGRSFDVAFTTFGVVGWLDDLDRWADRLAAHLRAGGHLYVADVHPAATPFSDVDADGAAFGAWSHSYFRDEPIRVDADGSYADAEANLAHTESVQYQHALADVVTAVTGRGLRLEFLHEFPWADFRIYQGMERDEFGRWWLPDDVPVDLPLTFSLRAEKT